MCAPLLIVAGGLCLSLATGCPAQEKAEATAGANEAGESEDKSGGKATGDPSANTEAPPSDPRKELFENLLVSCEEDPVTDPIALATKDGERPHADAIVVRVDQNGVAVDGAKLDPNSSIIERLEEEFDMRDFRNDARGKKLAAIHGAPDIPAKNVLDVASKIAKDDDIEVAMVLGRPPKSQVTAPKPEFAQKFAAELEAMEPAERSAHLAKELKTMIEPCPSLQDVFMRVANEAGNVARCKTLVNGLRDEVPKCSDELDADELLSALLSIVAPAKRSVPVVFALDVDPSGTAVSVPDGQTWSEFGPSWLESLSGPVSLPAP